MCGIAGYWLRQSRRPDPEAVDGLLREIRERGPDDEGVCFATRGSDPWRCSTEGSVAGVSARHPHFGHEAARRPHDLALVHSRYSIIDLSEGGHQPYVSRSGRYTASYNGEIYNYVELRRELEAQGVSFRTDSDTEVLVEGYEHWGSALWERMNGFWAVALYDAKDGSVVLCRDRFGVAPLYHRTTDEGFWFASSIRPLVAIGPGPAEYDAAMVSGFIETSLKDYDDKTCYRDVASLPPAVAFTFRPGVFRIDDAERHRFWEYPERRLSEADLPFAEAVRRFRETLFNAVEIRMRADVKVAFELSGGLDSSSVLAAAAASGHDDTMSFTIKVPERDEEPFARTMCDKYPRLDYRVLHDSEEDFFDHAGPFTRTMEEPYHSPNIYTHYKMRQKMKDTGVAVVLCGSGGDEALAGYIGQFWPKAREEMKANGSRGRALAHQLFTDYGTLDQARRSLRRTVRRLLGKQNSRNVSRPALDGASADLAALRYRGGYDGLTFQQQRHFHFEIGQLPYYLRGDDHFTMAIPLEHRFPLLDYRIVELGMQVPISYLFHNGWNKYLLRKAMEPYLPEAILWRKTKMGFPFAHGRFLREHRAQFEPIVRAVNDAGLLIDGNTDYDALLAQSVLRLWRICSVGLWLEHQGQAATLAAAAR